MKRALSVQVLALLACWALGPASPWWARAQSNLVVNGSFEAGSDGWQFSGGAHFTTIALLGSVEGTNYASVTGPVSQDITTVPGRDYIIKFAYRTYPPAVTWGGVTVAAFTNRTGVGSWSYVDAFVRADAEVTTLRFDDPTNSPYSISVDDVRVGWLQEPISILAQPESHSGFEGSTATFFVIAQGGPPLSYQWSFSDAPIWDATNSILSLAGLRAVQAGNYSVLVSNVAGSLQSTSVSLSVEAAVTAPLILVQPEGQILPAGYAYTLRALAVGQNPLGYQWYRDNVALVGATNSSLSYTSMSTTNAGTYIFVASNALGTAASLPAVIAVTATNSGGGWFMVSNSVAIKDVDGTTRLSSTQYSAQTYVGTTPDMLRPLGGRAFFRTNNFAGFFNAPRFVIPDIPPANPVYAQIRAWETALGQTYEEARASGGKFGSSEIRQYTTTASPGAINLIASFNLRAGLPFFYTGRLSSGPVLPDGTAQFVLSGQPGFRYLIEKQTPPNHWNPFLVVTNTTGTLTFSDPSPATDAVQFYRARILD